MYKNIIFLLLIGGIVFFVYQYFFMNNNGVASNLKSIDTSKIENSTSSIPSQSISASERKISVAEKLILPLSGSAPTKNVKITIPAEKIKQGCFRQDCIPSVDSPTFVDIKEADKIIDNQSIGLALTYKNIDRFYPFIMLVTHEIVNDTIAGDPILVTYCPLCGTGIVFNRLIDGKEQEFGVSGMLWQSNLLMYNRANDVKDRNLWSQALGEAVVGEKAGQKLTIIPSDIVRFGDWKKTHQDGEVLDTGNSRDPYSGNYYEVAKNFTPDFDEKNSLLDPSAYVYGVEIDGIFKAYPKNDIPVGTTKDTIGNTTITINKKEDGEVTMLNAKNEVVTDTEGFWFSWIAIHPSSLLWQK